MRKKHDFYDDGRTIADMDVEGMPHRVGKPREYAKKKTADDGPQLTKQETRQLVFSGMLAGGVLAVLFIAAALILILVMIFFS